MIGLFRLYDITNYVKEFCNNNHMSILYIRVIQFIFVYKHFFSHLDMKDLEDGRCQCMFDIIYLNKKKIFFYLTIILFYST